MSKTVLLPISRVVEILSAPPPKPMPDYGLNIIQFPQDATPRRSARLAMIKAKKDRNPVALYKAMLASGHYTVDQMKQAQQAVRFYRMIQSHYYDLYYTEEEVADAFENITRV